MNKKEIIQAMKKWYMPNFFDLDMFDYTKLKDEEVYKIYLEEKETYGEEVDEMLIQHI